MLIKTPLLHQSLGPHVCLFLSLSLYLWLIPWSAKVSCTQGILASLGITQGILASFLLSLSHRRLQTIRFWFNKGPTAKGKEKKKRYTHLNAEFQRIARKDK